VNCHAPVMPFATKTTIFADWFKLDLMAASIFISITIQ
jgi:hypothetical protein